MTKQKHGFLVFIASLIPGAGEMYMGFRKQGISIMLLFWGTFALTSVINMGWIMLILPILWFYSFFNVHNLKSLSEEDFYSVEDSYILHLDQFIGSTDSAFMTYAEQNGREMWMEYNMQAVNGKVLLSINITDYSDVSEEPTEELTEDEYARIGEAVTGAFGDVYSEDVSGETEVLEDMPEATPMPIPVEAV